MWPDAPLPPRHAVFMSIKHKPDKIFCLQDIYLTQGKVAKEKGSKKKLKN